MLQIFWILKSDWIGSNIRFSLPPNPTFGNNVLSTKQKLSFLWIEEKGISLACV